MLTEVFSDKFEDIRKNGYLDSLQIKKELPGYRPEKEDQKPGSFAQEHSKLDFRDKNVILYGDTFIKLKHQGTLTNSKMFRLAFHCGNVGLETEYTIKDLDPDTLCKDSAFTHIPYFSVTVKLEDIPETQLHGEGQTELRAQREGRQKVIDILTRREAEKINPLDSQRLVYFLPDFDDRDEMMVLKFEDSAKSEGESENED